MNQLTVCITKEDLVSEAKKQCKKCQNVMTERNYCIECKHPVFAQCIGCNYKELVDLHEFCYCQLDLFGT